MDYHALANARKSAPFDGTFNDAADLAIFNSPDTTAALVSQGSVPKNTFIQLTVQASLRMALGGNGADSKTPLVPASVTKWQTAIARADASDPASPIDLGLVSLFGNPVTDNVMTQAEYNALFMRQPFVYETKAGLPYGTVLTMDDMARSHP